MPLTISAKVRLQLRKEEELMDQFMNLELR